MQWIGNIYTSSSEGRTSRSGSITGLLVTCNVWFVDETSRTIGSDRSRGQKQKEERGLYRYA